MHVYRMSLLMSASVERIPASRSVTANPLCATVMTRLFVAGNGLS